MSNIKGKDNYTVMPQVNAVDIVPAGGTAGQVLTKTSAANYVYTWTTPTAGVVSVAGTPNQVVVTGTASPVVSLAPNLILPGTASVTIPNGTTAQRPGAPTVGMQRYNTTIGVIEFYNGTNWIPVRGTAQTLYQEIGQSTFSNSVIPYDTTVPLSTEGTSYATVVITTTTATSKVFGRFNGWFDTSTNNRQVIMSAFRGTTCIDAAVVNAGASGRPVTGSVSFIDIPGSIGTFTYTIRIGTDSNTTIYVNRGTAATLGSVSSSQFVLQEVL